MNEKSEKETKAKSKKTKAAKKQVAVEETVQSTDAADTGATESVVESVVENQTEPEIYRVEKQSGLIQAVSKADAVADLTSAHSEVSINNMMTKGRVLASERAYYSTNRAKLAKFEKEQPTVEPNALAYVNIPESTMTDVSTEETPSESAETPASDTPQDEGKPDLTIELDEGASQAEIEVGSYVSNGERWGEVVNKDGKMKVAFVHPTTGNLTTVKLTNEYKVMTQEEVEVKQAETALAKQEGEPKPIARILSDEEKAEFDELERKVDEQKQTLEQAPLNIASHLATIQEKGYWLTAGYEYFKDYIVGRFGFTREYGQNLAKIGSFMHVAAGSLEGIDLSVRASLEFATGTNKLKESLGLNDAEFNELKPIITNAIDLFVDNAPVDKDGNKIITQRVVSKFNETLSDVLTTKTVSIDGKDMKVSEAKKKGVLNTAFRENYINAAAESIKANSQLIADRAKASYESNHKPPAQLPESPSQKVYHGVAPAFGGGCRTHGTKITAIFYGNFQTACGCRWRVSTDGYIECYECDGKIVKQ